MASLRKLLFVVLVVLLAVFCSAALADTGYSLSPAPLSVTLKDNRTVVTADTLGDHPELLTVIGMSKEDTLADWQSRGVVLQAWSTIDPKTWNASKSKYTCLEICVLQDADAARYPDLMQNPGNKDDWREYIASYKNSDTWTSLGYTFQFGDKDLYHADNSYYLLLKYKRAYGAGDYRGYMARTVWKGYTLVFDLKVYNQLPTDTHSNELYRVIKTLKESGAEGLPAVSGEAGTGEGTGETPAEGGTENTSGTSQSSERAKLEITVAPPKETNTGVFTVEGVTVPGAEVIGVLMKSVGDPLPQKFNTVANSKTGSFKLQMTIPEAEESVWLVTLNVYESPESSGYPIAEKVFDFNGVGTTYKKTLIPLELDGEVPEQYYADELVISGTTMKAVDVQCIVTDSSGSVIKNGDQKSRPNGTGRFSFKIPLKDEDTYEIALIITKKGYDTKRFTWKVSRYLTDEARQAMVRKQAARVGYGTLSSRIDQYVGKTLVFSVWITGIEQVGEEWHIHVSGAKTGEHYSQNMIFITEEEPSFAVEEKHTLYGKCIGPFKIESEEGTDSIPSFDLILCD